MRHPHPFIHDTRANRPGAPALLRPPRQRDSLWKVPITALAAGTLCGAVAGAGRAVGLVDSATRAIFSDLR
jgi:hypothetical protein